MKKRDLVPVVPEIVVCMMPWQSYHKEVFGHFMTTLRVLLGDAVSVRVVEVPDQSAELFAMSLHRQEIAKTRVVMSIGFQLTRYLLDIFSDSESRPHLVGLGADIGHDDAVVSQGWASVISTEQDPVLERRCELLMFFKPSMSRVGVPFLADTKNLYVHKQLGVYRAYFARYAVDLCLIPVDSLDRLESAVSEYIRTLDALMVIEADACSHEYARLIPLCNAHAVTFFGATLKAAKAGAALSYGVDVSLPAREAATRVAALIKGEAEAVDMQSFAIADSRRLIVNIAAGMRQGLALSKTVLSFLRNGVAFSDVKSIGPLVRESLE